MNRSHLNLLFDMLAAVALVAMIATGYILRFPLPPTTNRTHELWGVSRHEWGAVHSWVSLAFLAVLFVHVMLHWEWIFATVRRRFTSSKAEPNQKLRAGIVALALLTIIGGLFAWATQTGTRKLETPLHPLRETAITTVDFQRDVMSVFEASCVGCHGPKKQRAGFRVDRREDFFAPGDPKPLIVPGRWEQSRLRAIVTGQVTDMKFAGEHLLPAREIAVLKAWINSGAKWQDEAPSNPSPVKP
ncbi:MAG: hypothetical protein RLZZ214_2662 [Verrucomicrobiota bacterium]|jgi:mono/diheme cytochrome c family protein